ncbi:hypothetical protein E4U35_004607 [Claviceps purpurea]|nr:hypothetical protein E4U51_000435 [Claviceps purpurea]KAG6191219.1 hypothetical protein E4U36_000677 [Claviceps purpurea]KAG6202227.1 hypothetical protein E4U10_000079 [Claviceps purpurea]KAG6203137.1 hypothetical protein E4U35_004607 [Claviceps purpurea]KAG6308121.1 hypothetical protein E4U45_002422 [Claviceps purpurea]
MFESPFDALTTEAIHPTKDALLEAINSIERAPPIIYTANLANVVPSLRILLFDNAKELPDEDSWALRYQPETNFATHNHAPSSRLTAHPTHRQLRPDEDPASIISLSEVYVPLKYVHPNMVGAGRRTKIRVQPNEISIT